MSPSWLTQLAPDHAPGAPGWWPPAPGWWGVFLLLVVLSVGVAWWLLDPYRMPRRVALRELRRIRASSADVCSIAQAIENLLRRYALTVFGGSRVAKLTGEAWLSFVTGQGAHLLAGHSGRALLAAAFGGRAEDDRERWLAAAEAFIRRAGRGRRNAVHSSDGSEAPRSTT